MKQSITSANHLTAKSSAIEDPLIKEIKSNSGINLSKQTKYTNIAKKYVTANEELLGITVGGGESLVLFINDLKSKKIIVRKIWDSKLLSIDWKEDKKNIIMSPPIKKGYLQVEYLRGLPKQAKQYFPQIYKVKKRKDLNGILTQVICDESYIPGIEVSKFILKYRPPVFVVARLYIEIFRCLKDTIHKHRRTEVKTSTLEISYFKKIEDRLTATKTAIPSVITCLTSSEYIYINGRKYINIHQLINKYRKLKILNLLEPKYHCLVTGDTNTQNIKVTNIKPLLDAIQTGKADFTYHELGIKFLDPRSLGFNSEGRKTIDDFMYDNKPFHNSLGNYDMIYGKYFDLNFSFDDKKIPTIEIIEKNNPFKDSYLEIEKYFKIIMDESWKVSSEEFQKLDPLWLIRFTFLMGTHFAAMPPFQLEKHPLKPIEDDIYSQKKVVAIYCEGVKWLNLAYQMLTGKIKEHYGFIVPSLKSQLNNSRIL